MSDSKVPSPNVVHITENEIERERERVRLSPVFTIIFSGFALMSDGYQVGVLSLINVCFAKIYGDAYTSEMSTRLGNALFVGIVLGQVGFGFFCDRMGRKVGLLVTTFLVIIGAALCAGAYGAGGSIEGFFWALTIYRGILGVGVGGEYPCSSTNASESADSVMQGRRGMLVSLATNTMIDFGFVVAAIVPLILATAGCSYEVIWRVSFGFGVLPPLSVLYFRLRMTNSKIFQRNNLKRNVPYVLIIRRYWKYLLGTAGSWFIYDFIAYPFGIFSGTILDTAIGTNGTFVQTAEWMCLLNVFYLPGCIAGAFSADRIGRKMTMTLGFLLQGVLGILMGIFYKDLLGIFPLFVVLYGVFLGLGEYGPGDMVILTSAEIYPTAIRGTAYGWSAAIGKLGAICGTSAFKPAIASLGHGDVILGQSRVFILGSGLSLVGAIFAWLLIPDYTKQDLSYEDEAFKKYLEDNGYDVSYLGDASTTVSHESLQEQGVVATIGGTEKQELESDIDTTRL
ncbi:Plasma membrane permease, mediates uptake of glycerophosphoinositol and glycerophosphocholine [Linnemannia hyalina]|uniref:Plasma membrane permease, mediates uptake of glycerophosphoinositol and glycerophosphocholine n=1 Tax=Linnemannia hyalina TaxID=64524 RepID=A0A9P7XZJ2_9FUNG|nr:Plasma membrane permease, mediates uptake of glycerophosphoinositol and glycerophosphocholine [Linnemannia hyalina]